MEGEKMSDIDEINRFCLKQMEESVDKPSLFNEGLWLVCSKIHRYIASIGELGVIKE